VGLTALERALTDPHVVARCWATGCLHRTGTSRVRTTRELELTVSGLFVFLLARWSTARRGRGPAGAVGALLQLAP